MALKEIKQVAQEIIAQDGPVTMGLVKQGYILTNGVLLFLWANPTSYHKDLEKLPMEFGSYKGARFKKVDGIRYRKESVEQSIDLYNNLPQSPVKWVRSESNHELACQVQPSDFVLLSHGLNDSPFCGIRLRFLNMIHKILGESTPLFQNQENKVFLARSTDTRVYAFTRFFLFREGGFKMGDPRPTVDLGVKRGVDV